MTGTIVTGVVTGVVIVVVTGALVPLGWRLWMASSLYQMDGAVERIAFVVMTWGMGVCMLGLAPSVVYAQLCASIGVVLLALGTLKALPTISRWRRERLYWKMVALNSRTLDEALRRAGPDRHGHYRLPEPEAPGWPEKEEAA